MGFTFPLCSVSRIQAHPFWTGHYPAYAVGLFHKGRLLKDMNGKSRNREVFEWLTM